MIRQCTNCEHWQGNSDAYMADCTDSGQRTMFDYCCSHHVARQDAIDSIPVVAPDTRPITLTNPVKCSMCKSLNIAYGVFGFACYRCNQCGHRWK